MPASRRTANLGKSLSLGERNIFWKGTGKLDPLSLFEPDTLTQTQWDAQHRKIGPSLPERRLYVAVLAAAVDDYQKYRHAVGWKARVLFEDARDWFAAPATTWPFDFENLCAVVGLEPSAVRRTLMQAVPGQRTARMLYRVLGSGNQGGGSAHGPMAEGTSA